MDQTRRSTDFMSSHPATQDRIKNAHVNARQLSGPGTGERDATRISPASTARFMGKTRARDSCVAAVHPFQARLHLPPRPDSVDNTAQAVLGLKDGGTEAMQLDVVSVPAEQSCRLSDLRLDGGRRQIEPGGIHA